MAFERSIRAFACPKRRFGRPVTGEAGLQILQSKARIGGPGTAAFGGEPVSGICKPLNPEG
jgi:hypothetical protein